MYFVRKHNATAKLGVKDATAFKFLGGKMTALLWIDWINDRIGRGVSFLVWIGAVVLVWEVISRYVFGAPTIWAHGYTQRIFGSYFILIGAFAMLRGAHVRIDIFLPTKGGRKRAALDLLNYLMLLIWGLALAYEGWAFFQEALLWDEVDDGALGHPLWPIKLCLVIGAAMISTQAFAEIIRTIITLINPSYTHIRRYGNKS